MLVQLQMQGLLLFHLCSLRIPMALEDLLQEKVVLLLPPETVPMAWEELVDLISRENERVLKHTFLDM
jgi:hypothetical protein